MANGSLTGADAGRGLKYAGVGAVEGAAIGSVVPGVGTAVGAGVGAVVGGLVGLFGGGPDAQAHNANIGGQSITARQVFEQISPGTSNSVIDGADASATLQRTHSDRATQIAALNQKMDAAWQGDAAQAAQAGGHPLGTWLQDSASNLSKSHTFLTAQGESFETAKSKVQDVAATPPTSGFVDEINPMSDKDAEINKYNQQGQTNVDAFNAYYQSSATNAAGMPQFSAWQGNPLSGPGGGGAPVPGGGSPAHSGGGYGGGPSSGFGGSPYGAPGPVAHTAYSPSPSPGGHSSVTSPPGSQPWNTGTAPAAYTPATTTPSADFSSGFGPGGAGFGGGFGPGGSGSGAGSAAGGFGGAVGGFGPGGAGSRGAGASTGAGSGLGGSTNGGSMRGGAGGSAGRPGTSGMGGGGGKGEGSEDTEHQTKYLVAEDHNDLFGLDISTVPPVIGE